MMDPSRPGETLTDAQIDAAIAARKLARRDRRREALADASVPVRKLIPNLITIAAMCCGLASIYYAFKIDPATLTFNDGMLKRAVALIGLSALLDALDGRAARLLKVTSRFGETLDSMSDFVSFGVAPSVLIYRWSQGHTVMGGSKAVDGVGGADRTGVVGGYNLESLLVIALIAFTACSAIRLARFTAQARTKKLNAKPAPFFSGLPTPAAAGAALIPPMLFLSDLEYRLPVIAVIVWMLWLAAHQVSKIPMWSAKGGRVKRQLIAPLMVTVAIFVGAMATDAWLTVSVVSLLYVLSIPVSIAARKRWDAAHPAA